MGDAPLWEKRGSLLVFVSGFVLGREAKGVGLHAEGDVGGEVLNDEVGHVVA